MVELDLRVGKKGQILVPKVLRTKYGIEEGGRVIVEATDEGILVRGRPKPAEILQKLTQHAAKLRGLGLKGPKLGELKGLSLEMEFEEVRV